jgi:hypothetical protein
VPAFRTVWTATLVANIGAWMASVGTGWLMTTLDPSPIWVSLVGAATALPMFLFALPAGALGGRLGMGAWGCAVDVNQRLLGPVEIHREFITAAARWMMAAKL